MANKMGEENDDFRRRRQDPWCTTSIGKPFSPTQETWSHVWNNSHHDLRIVVGTFEPKNCILAYENLLNLLNPTRLTLSPNGHLVEVWLVRCLLLRIIWITLVRTASSTLTYRADRGNDIYRELPYIIAQTWSYCDNNYDWLGLMGNSVLATNREMTKQCRI